MKFDLIPKCPRFGLSTSFLIFGLEWRLFGSTLRIWCTSGPILGINLVTGGLLVTLLRFMRAVVQSLCLLMSKLIWTHRS